MTSAAEEGTIKLYKRTVQYTVEVKSYLHLVESENV